MQLPLRDDLGVATLGPQLKLKKNAFQGVVVQARDAADVVAVVSAVRALPRLRWSQRLPHASRVRRASSLHPSVLQHEEDGHDREKKAFRPVEDPAVAEDWEDDGEVGVGDRLLHVLQRWQVENVVLLVARRDDSLSGRLIGHEVFKLMSEAAKLVLEEYYVSHAKPSDVAKLQIYEDTRGRAQYIVSPRSNEAEEPTQKQQRPSVCLMSSDTVPSWPQRHQPTSDGGGRKVLKPGRVNHFLHGRNGPTADKPSAQSTRQDSNQVAAATEEQPQGQPHPDTLAASGGGIEWLGISRDEWLKLRAIRVPVKELHYLFMCLVVLADKPLEEQSKAAPTTRLSEEFTPPSYSWNRCREVLQHTALWSEKLRHFQGSALTKSQVTALRSVFQEPTLNEAAFVRISDASVRIFTWLQRLLDEYDEHALGITPDPTPASPRPLTPQPPPRPQQQPAYKPLPVSEESALLKELNALAQQSSKKNKIVDRGRLLSPSDSQC